MMNLSAVPSFDHQIKLRFLDVQAEIRSDSPRFIEFFGRMYSRFQIQDFQPPALSPLQFAFLTSPQNPWGMPVLFLEGNPIPLRDPALLHGYVYDSILNTILARIRSHFLIHAGAVARDGQGILLSADSGHGKTTLVLELVRRGYKFLSDELAPISRQDGRLEPFPRSLRIRPPTPDLYRFPALPPEAPIWLDKYILDIEALQPSSLSGPVAVKYVIILKDYSIESDAQAARSNEIGVYLDRIDRDLILAASRITGVSGAWGTEERGYPVLRLRSEEKMAALEQVEKLCRDRGVLVLDVSRRPLSQPHFDGPSRLEVIPKSQAVKEMLRQYQPGHKSSLLREEFHGSAIRLFMDLAGCLDQAKCHYLGLGPLGEMAGLIDGLVP